MFAAIVLSVLGQSPMSLDAVIAAWEARYRDSGAIEVMAEGEVITTPVFVAGLQVPTDKLSDKPLPVVLHAKIDFAGERAWLRRDEFEWNAPAQAFQRKITETTITPDGTSVRFIDPKTDASTTRLYHDPSARQRVKRIDVQALWLSSGVVTPGDPAASLFKLPDYKLARQQRRWSIVPDDPERSKGRIEITIAGLTPSGPSYSVHVDASDQYVVRALVERDTQDRVTSEIRIRYKRAEGLLLPIAWETSAFAAEKLMIHEEIKVRLYRTNCQFSDFPFAPQDKR
ncbi:MAG: hypothetical protein KY475_02930 [Planctomycetes bacterium]|nr:hypothetical protein [Planctomycetota bacterium]